MCMINAEHPRESCTSLAWELLLQETPIPCLYTRYNGQPLPGSSSANCFGSFLIPLLSGDPEVMGRCMWDIVRRAHAVRREGSAGSAHNQVMQEGGVPVLNLKLSLWLPRAEPEELQGKVTLIPLLWLWCSLTSAQGGDNAAIYRLLGFPCCVSLPCNLNLTATTSKWFAASFLLRAAWAWNKNWSENLLLFVKETDYIQHDQTINKSQNLWCPTCKSSQQSNVILAKSELNSTSLKVY